MSPVSAPEHSNASSELEQFRSAIRARYDMKERAFEAGDARTILTKFYGSDPIVVGEGDKQIFVGEQAVGTLYEQVVQQTRVKVTSVYSYVRGDLGWDWVDFRVTPQAESSQPVSMIVLVLWERVGTEWKCKGDMFVSGSFGAS